MDSFSVGVVAGFGFFFGDSVLLLLRTGKPGLAPAGHLLFCFAKKVGKKGDPQSMPLRGSQKCAEQNGKRNKLAALRQISLLYPFCSAHFWHRQQGLKGQPIPTLTLPLKGREW